MELTPELQGTAITLINAMVSLIVFKVKSYQGKAAREKRRADAIAEAVDSALADGHISKEEISRIVRVADRAAGV